MTPVTDDTVIVEIAAIVEMAASKKASDYPCPCRHSHVVFVMALPSVITG